MLERGFRLRVLEGLCDVGLVVEFGLGNWRGGDREPDGGERVCGGDHTEERWRTEERESLMEERENLNGVKGCGV
jgi:hypothetical protein